MVAFLIDFAERRHLSYHRDSAGNVLIRKRASEGMEQRPVTILQSHMDMVCEKNSDVSFDFLHDAIRTRIHEGWVMAEGTTLGADCGIGMAAALALLDSSDLQHGALECLFTIDEETGLTGAFALDDDLLTGRVLLNLDSEDEGQLFIGCAGGADTTAVWSYTPTAVPRGPVFYRVDLNGLTGGHSGDDIDKGRGNANKLLARFLLPLDRDQRMALSVGYIDGGNLRNAIPREAFALFGVAERETERLERYFADFRDDLCDELHTVDPQLALSLAPMPAPERVIDSSTMHRLLDALAGMPNGVLAMSRTMPGMVETSTNLASIKFVGDSRIEVGTSQRSERSAALDAASTSVEAVFRLAGTETARSGGYPGWTPNPHSPLLETVRSAYRRLFGQEPVVRSIHAGLECGVFLQKYPSLDMISFGPTLRGVHSPDERLDIASVTKFWQLLVESVRTVGEKQD